MTTNARVCAEVQAMPAFVSAAGLSLSSRRVFVQGSNASLSQRPTRSPEPHISTDISALKLPKLPSLPTLPNAPKLPKLPDLPNLPIPNLGGGKKQPVARAPPKAAKDVKPSPPVVTKLTVGGRSVEPKKPAAPSPAPANLKSGIPKFYNPATARAEYRATAKGQNATPYDIRINGEKNTTNRRINVQKTFRNMDPYTDDLFWARPGWSSDEARLGVRIALRNVLGNAYLFESELEELSSSISCVTRTANMKEFVRAIGLSHAYRSRFFESTSNTRFVECNFLHFLGRAPHTQEEVSQHIKIINEQGYNAEINSYVDCDEYDTLFGETRIPAVNFRGGHPYNIDMNKLAMLNGGFGRSDRLTKKAFLPTGDATGFSAYGVNKGLPEAWRGENKAREEAGPVSEFSPDVFWNPQPIGLREAEIAWISKYGNWTKFWYKDSAIYKDMMKPKLSHSDAEVEEANAILKYGVTMAKNYIGSRKTFDVAPVIDLTPPSSSDVYNGQLSVKMQEITFGIPAELQQTV